MHLSLTLTNQILIPLRPFLTGIVLSFYRVFSTPVFTVFWFEFHLKWCYKRRFATTSFRATILEHCWNNSKRCRNTACRVALKMSLQIVPCSTAFKHWWLQHLLKLSFAIFFFSQAWFIYLVMAVKGFFDGGFAVILLPMLKGTCLWVSLQTSLLTRSRTTSTTIEN